MSKQDRQGVRTPAEVERKYNFGSFMYDQKKKDEEQNRKIEQASENASNNIALLKAEVEKELSKISKELKKIQVSSSVSLESVSQKIREIDVTDSEQSKAIEELSSLVETLSESVEALRQIVSELGGGSGSGMVVCAETESLNSEAIYADKTFTEIDEAINTGSVVRVKLLCSNINDYVYLHLASHLPGVEVTFCGYFNGLPVNLQLQADDTSTS